MDFGASSGLESKPEMVSMEKKKFSVRSSWIIIPGTVCRMTGISMMYFGLTRTSVSSYEMLKGSLIIFTAINSKFLLKQQITWKKWVSMAIIIFGLIIVGLADIIQPSKHNLIGVAMSVDNSSYKGCHCKESEYVISKEVGGNILVVISQIFLALQFVYEEKILNSYEVEPLQAVVCDGFYGLIFMSFLLVPLSYIDTVSCLWSNSPDDPWTLEDAVDGFTQIGNNGLLVLSLFCYVVFVAFYISLFIAVNKEFGAMATMTMESIRAIVVWMISLCVGWQEFQYLQLIGFCVMNVGIFLSLIHI